MDVYKNKKVLVTGATGLIGSNLTEKLLSFGNVQVYALARNEDKIKELFKKYLNNNNFKYIIQDITEPLNFTEDFDYIFNAAGSIAGDVIRKYPVDIINANLKGIQNCLDYINSRKKGRLIVFSSATVYGNNTGKNLVVSEDDTTVTDKLSDRICAYSQSKRMAETLANAYFAQYGTDVVIARFSYVYGFTKFYPKTAFFEFIKKALNGEDIILNGTSFARRDNIYVQDAVNMLLCVAAEGVSGEAYNISCAEKSFAAIDEIAEEIANAANKIKNNGVKVIKKYFDEGVRSAGIIMNNAKTQALSCFRGGGRSPLTALTTGIFETVNKFNQEIINSEGGAKMK